MVRLRGGPPPVQAQLHADSPARGAVDAPAAGAQGVPGVRSPLGQVAGQVARHGRGHNLVGVAHGLVLTRARPGLTSDATWRAPGQP